MRSYISSLFLFSCSFWFASSVLAQTEAGRREVTQCVSEMSGLLKKEFDTRLLSVAIDSLKKEGDSINYRLTLQKEMFYVFAACGESTFEDLDIKVYNGEGLLAIKDDKPGKRPVLSFNPPTTSAYTIKMLSTKGSGYYAFIRMAKANPQP